MFDKGGRDAHDVASPTLGDQLTDDRPGDVEEPVDVGGLHRGVVLVGVVGERLGEEEPGVVDEGVDAAEPLDRRRNDALGHARIRDVACDCRNALRRRGRDRTRVGNHGVAEALIGRDQRGSDSLGSAGDHGDLACVHGRLNLAGRSTIPVDGRSTIGAMGRTSDARERLVAAATELFSERAYGAVGIAEIASRAGVQKGSFYYFFSSKEALALAVIDQHWAWQRGQWEQVLKSEGTALEHLRGIFDATTRMQARALQGTGSVTGCMFGNLALEVSSI